MAADTPRMWSRHALRRPALAVVALVVVALAATACLPPPPPAAPQATIAQCPVDGFTYGNGFGPLGGGGFHYGVDMGAPEGTPVYAVRNGTLWAYSTGDVGGYSLYLMADDGNTYYYTHLSPYDPSFENTTRQVVAGGMIETVSHTGNADGFNHLHFEIRVGGPNGAKIDPRPTLDAAGCA